MDNLQGLCRFFLDLIFNLIDGFSVLVLSIYIPFLFLDHIIFESHCKLLLVIIFLKYFEIFSFPIFSTHCDGYIKLFSVREKILTEIFLFDCTSLSQISSTAVLEECFSSDLSSIIFPFDIS